MISKRQLRRLAFAAHRRPELRAVLHDALLEAYPKMYEAHLEVALRISRDRSAITAILFDPRSLSSSTRHPFTVFRADGLERPIHLPPLIPVAFARRSGLSHT